MSSIAITLTFVVLWVVMMIRIRLVHDARMRRLDEVHAEVMRLINARSPDWRKPWRVFDEGPSYDRMLFDLTRWTYKQFYPEAAND